MSEQSTPSPLTLAAMGSFHVGGRDIVVSGEPLRTTAFTPHTTVTYDPNGHYTVEQAYVQWFRPARPLAERPVLLVHGGGLTGASWETTPDGRAGWLELFLRRGFPVFVIDNVERGRAGFCALPGIWEGQPMARNAEWAWELFRFGPQAGYPDRPFPGQRFPIAQLAQFARSFVPRWTSTNEAQVAALVAAIRRIGPLDLICHSHGGELALRAAALCPAEVRAVVALEPSGYSEALDPARQRVLTVLGDFLDCDPYAAARTARMRAFADALTARGVRNELWEMAARGRAGHSHMLMMDHGSEALADDVATWLLSA
ncbi:MAG: alpha/beta fold hydrolase [Rhodospirillales bacterium]|nr:alpha/beta fold hydrolase [Rhodospirillales bacterium]